jgi:hypothetical protein
MWALRHVDGRPRLGIRLNRHRFEECDPLACVSEREPDVPPAILMVHHPEEHRIGAKGGQPI